MKVLVIGQGGREHALVRALKLSNSVNEVHALPGNDGFTKDSVTHDISPANLDNVVETIKSNAIDLVVIGPEAHLAEGLSDHLRSCDIDVFGPSKAAAQLEASKVFAKEFMDRGQIPTAPYFVVSSVEETLKAAESFEAPYVLKADGLAAGKGVVIAQSLEELKEAAHQFFNEKIFGEAGSKALLEEFQKGWELSFHILTNGTHYAPLPMAQDHKRIYDGDEGPNTGGMGVVGPLKIDKPLLQQLHEQILQASVDQLKKDNLDYRGVLYVGVMVTENGPKVIEYNVRFGDPEAQVMLPLLDGDWGEVMKTIAKGDLKPLNWKPLYTACVVLAAENYPVKPVKGVEIQGDPMFETPSSYFLHAGTKKDASNNWLTNGGRVLNAVAIGSTMKEAINNAYTQVQKVSWSGMQVRNDIGQKILNQ